MKKLVDKFTEEDRQCQYACPKCSNYRTETFLGYKFTGCACGMHPSICLLNKSIRENINKLH